MLRSRFLSIALLPLLAASLFACGDDENEGQPDVGDDTGADVAPDAAPDSTPVEDVTTDTEDTTSPPLPFPYEDCDPLQPEVCALPWPSNLYLKADETRETGFTLTFGPTTLPRNNRGDQITPDIYQRLDGYSVGSALLVYFPGLDISGMPTEYNPGGSMALESATLWYRVDADGSLSRVPHWVEFDSHATSPEDQLIFVRPAVILEEGTRYVVAMRNLRTSDGNPIARSEAFDALVRGETSDTPTLAARQEHFNEIFSLLEAQGVEMDDVVLAWDFVTASSEALHGNILHMRDEGLALVGESGPELTVRSVREFTVEQDPDIALEMQGTLEVPHYVYDQGDFVNLESWALRFGDDGLPEPEGTRTVRWWAMVPHSAINQPEVPHGLIQYGHGLLGEGDQTFSGFNRRIANQYNYIFFGGDMSGMTAVDYPNIIGMLQDMNRFYWLSDRLHQGLFEHLVTARAFRERFGELEEISSRGVTINQEDLAWSGISQGGIFGATLMALTTDMQHGHLGVPGNHYNMLLFRSVDFTPFFGVLANSYANAIDQAVVLSMVQLLWDSADPMSYLRHISAEPFPGTPAHSILLVPAKADWQVSVTTNEIAARSGIDIAIMQNYDTERTVWGVDETPYPRTGSGVVLYDYGNPWPADNINLPPADEIGDPHSKPRQETWHAEQLVHFLRNGEIIDVCGGDGCTPD